MTAAADSGAGGRSAGERAHYRELFEGPVRDGRALLVVLGNCQAESLRLLLESDDVHGVRLPAVHELTADDVEHLHRLLPVTDLLVSQPVADDYHGLPLGTAQVRARLPRGARTALVPSLRYAGLHPFHVLVHPPGLDHAEPPVAPYHDLRTAVRAAWAAADRPAPPAPPLTADAVRAIGLRSVAALRDRQERHATVVVDDLFTAPTFAAMRTINHPGNPVLEVVAARLRDTLGLDPRPPGTDRPLLDGIHAPRDAVVVAERDPATRPTGDWRIDGRVVTSADVERAHLAHYAAHPRVLDAVLARAAPELEVLGLPTPGQVGR